MTGIHNAKLRSLMIGFPAAVLALLVATGCNTTRSNLEGTSRNPASTGSVTAQHSKDGNTTLLVSVNHLPPPSTIDESLRTYVVWVRPAGTEKFLPLGTVDVGDNRSGKLAAVTPYDDFFVLVTGEETKTPEKPSQYVMLQGEVK